MGRRYSVKWFKSSELRSITETGSTGLRAWHAVQVLSGPPLSLPIGAIRRRATNPRGVRAFSTGDPDCAVSGRCRRPFSGFSLCRGNSRSWRPCGMLNFPKQCRLNQACARGLSKTRRGPVRGEFDQSCGSPSGGCPEGSSLILNVPAQRRVHNLPSDNFSLVLHREYVCIKVRNPLLTLLRDTKVT